MVAQGPMDLRVVPVVVQAMASHLRVVLVHPRKAMPGEQRQTLVWLSTLVVVVVGLLLSEVMVTGKRQAVVVREGPGEHLSYRPHQSRMAAAVVVGLCWMWGMGSLGRVALAVAAMGHYRVQLTALTVLQIQGEVVAVVRILGIHREVVGRAL